MADGVTVDNGSLTDYKVATDDAGASGQVPLVKIAYSADGSASLVTADANGLLVAPGTAAASLGKKVDDAAGATDTGVALLAVRDDTTGTLTPADGDYTTLRVNSNGELWTMEAGAWSAATDSVAIGSVAGQGYTPQQFIDVDETEDEVKGTAGTLHSIIATNVAASTRYLKVYDGTAAGVTVGSTTPKWTIALPAGAGFVWESSIGIACATGITIAATTGVAVADTGAPGTNDVVVSVGYK